MALEHGIIVRKMEGNILGLFTFDIGLTQAQVPRGKKATICFSKLDGSRMLQNHVYNHHIVSVVCYLGPNIIV